MLAKIDFSWLRTVPCATPNRSELPATVPPPAPSEWFAPVKGDPQGFAFYVHGGSFIVDRSAKLTARFAAAANARVYAPSYRLAPEHPCPAAVDDIVAAFRWFRDEWPDEPVVALGDSAGGSVLLDALQELRDAGGDLTVRRWAAETHVWEQTSSACARQSIELASDFIRRCLASPEPPSPVAPRPASGQVRLTHGRHPSRHRPSSPRTSQGA